MAKKKSFDNIIEETPSSLESQNDLAQSIDAYTQSETDIRVNLKVGLSQEEVTKRLQEGRYNKQEHPTYKSNKEIIFKNIFTIFNIFNLVIAIALIVAQSYKNLLFLPIVAANTVIGIIQEIRARKTIEKLSLVEAPMVHVIRDGHKQSILSDQVVVDDICYYETGNQIVADSVLKKGQIEVNESMLTGEADNVIKKAGSLLYSGSFVVSGDCLCKVERVGKSNYINQLSNSVKKYSKPKSEIKHALDLLIKVLTVSVVLLGAALFTNNILVSHDWKQAIIYTAGAMIGMIPTGLYLMTSVSLAAGIITLAKKNTLCQDLYCIEMLARVDTICLDKTGTLTDGSMKIKNVEEIKSTSISLKTLMNRMLGNVKGNNATFICLEKEYGHVKRPTSKNIIPFSSQRKFMAYYDDDLKQSVIVGAPEYILKKSYVGSLLQQKADVYAKQGLRVLAVCVSDEMIESQDYTFNNATPLYLIAIEDVIRDSAIETIKYFKESGVEVKVISGDNPLTVSKIASRVGIENASKYVSLAGYKDDEVAAAALKYTIFGRVTPKQKQIIVKTLKENGKTVAMTGDGVNDTLALKEADCSIAMASGSEAARNISHIVLLNSDFSSMSDIVAEGRRVINNIKRVATMYLTKTLFSFLLTFVCLVSGNVYPIQTVQLTLMDIIVVTIPCLILALSKNNNKVSGKFLKDIILGALPGAILIVINYLFILLVLHKFANINDHAVLSSLVILEVSAITIMVLFKACKPFNLSRIILFAITCAVYLIAYIVAGEQIFEILSISHLGLVGILLLLVVILYSTHLFKLFFRLKDFMVNKEYLKMFNSQQNNK